MTPKTPAVSRQVFCDDPQAEDHKPLAEALRRLGLCYRDASEFQAYKRKSCREFRISDKPLSGRARTILSLIGLAITMAGTAFIGYALIPIRGASLIGLFPLVYRAIASVGFLARLALDGEDKENDFGPFFPMLAGFWLPDAIAPWCRPRAKHWIGRNLSEPDPGIATIVTIISGIKAYCRTADFDLEDLVRTDRFGNNRVIERVCTMCFNAEIYFVPMPFGL